MKTQSPAQAPPETVQTLSIRKEIEIHAPLALTFASVLDELGSGSQLFDGTPSHFKLEPWPGGRWYRDLGDKGGHFWGHVQVIKPPTLIELCGPMFMSYPAMNFVQYRLEPMEERTKLTLTHRAIGLIPLDHSQSVHTGWDQAFRRISESARAKAGVR